MTSANLDDIFADICRMEGPLSDRLNAFTVALSDLGLPSSKAYANLVEQLKTSADGPSVPQVGDALAEFLLPDHVGHLVRLSDLLERGPLAVSFNRGHWCQYCELELLAFTQAQMEIARHGATVVSIIPERREFIREVYKKCDGRIIVLTDMDNSYALELGLAVWVGDEVRRVYTDIGFDLERYQGNNMWFVPIPATFVVDRSGRIVARFVDPDFRKRMDIDQVVGALKVAESA